MPQIRFRFATALLALAATAAAPAFATTAYNYVGTNYSVFYDNCTPPGNPSAGPCVTYTSAMHAQGWFSLDTPLPANFGPTDISARSDLQWSFTDGVNAYASADTAHAHVSPGNFKVQTDAMGNIVYSGTVLGLELRQTTLAVNNYFDFLNIGYRPYSPPVGDYANTGWICLGVTGNECMESSYGANIANAASSAAGIWTSSSSASTTATAPTLGSWAILGLLTALLGFGARILRRSEARIRKPRDRYQASPSRD